MGLSAATAEILEKNHQEEMKPLDADEQKIADEAVATLTEEQKATVTERDILLVVRGYQTYEPRQEETNKALQLICDWRAKINYPAILEARLDDDENFHQYWEETIYGVDKYGHFVVGIKVGEIKTDALIAMDEQKLEKLQAQKLAVINRWKESKQKETGVQRYKHTLIVDLKGVGMSIVGSSKRGVMQKIFKIGTDYFPESIWQIHVVNAPFIFRAAWAVVKPWIHPITVAKVNILSSSPACLKQIEEFGLPPDQCPEYLGGGHKGTSVYQYLQEVIAEESQKKTTGALEAAAEEQVAANGDTTEDKEEAKAAPKTLAATLI